MTWSKNVSNGIKGLKKRNPSRKRFLQHSFNGSAIQQNDCIPIFLWVIRVIKESHASVLFVLEKTNRYPSTGVVRGVC